MRVAVEETLDRLPEKFTRQIYAQKCDVVYQHVFDSYWDDGHSVYDASGVARLIVRTADNPPRTHWQ